MKIVLFTFCMMFAYMWASLVWLGSGGLFIPEYVISMYMLSSGWCAVAIVFLGSFAVPVGNGFIYRNVLQWYVVHFICGCSMSHHLNMSGGLFHLAAWL